MKIKITESVIKHNPKLNPIVGRDFTVYEMESKFPNICCISGCKINRGDKIVYARVNVDNIWYTIVALADECHKQSDQLPLHQEMIQVIHPAEHYRIPEDKISEPTKQATDLFVKSNCNIIFEARAGAGKTTNLRHLASYTDPTQKVYYLAFNKKNAVEGKAKLPKHVHSITTHVFGKQIISNNMPNSKLDKQKLFKIINEVNPEHPKEAIRKMLRSAIAQLVSLAKNYCYNGDKSLLTEIMNFHNFDPNVPEGMLVDYAEMVLKLSLPTREQMNKGYDFDDMIWWPSFDDFVFPKVDVAFADECQDFNRCQIKILSRLKEGNARLVAVGDPFQSLYFFRGADSKAFNSVQEVVGGEKIILPINYRCSRNVINYVVEKTHVKDIKCRDDAPDGMVNVDHTYAEILQKIYNKELGDEVAILCRTNFPLIIAAFTLIRNRQKVKIIGRDIGAKLRNVVEDISEPYHTIHQFQANLDIWYDKKQAAADKKAKKNERLAKELIAEAEDTYESLMAMCEDCHTVKEIINNINSYFSDDETSTPDTITLSTTHRSKGLEFNTVIIIRYDMIPHSKAVSEEDLAQEANNRYVALTRTKMNLYITCDRQPDKKREAEPYVKEE